MQSATNLQHGSLRAVIDEVGPFKESAAALTVLRQERRSTDASFGESGAVSSLDCVPRVTAL